MSGGPSPRERESAREPRRSFWSRCRDLPDFAAWLLVAAFAVILRFFALFDQIPMQDEWHALVRVTGAGYRGIALSFGINDHSIPWTIYLETIDRLVGIDPVTFFGPGALAALIFGLALPAMARREIGNLAALLWATLLASSPLLIDYARTARPYGVTALLAPLAVLFWTRWLAGGTSSRRYAAAYLVATATVGYSLPPHLPFCLAPFLLPVSWRMLLTRERRGEWTRLAAGVLLVTFALLGPPAYLDWKDLDHRIAAAALESSLLLSVPVEMARFRPALLGAAVWGLALVGAAAVWRSRERRQTKPETFARAFAGALAFASLMQIAAVLVVHPYGVSHRIVMARYLLPVVPVLLLAAALGVERLAGRWLVAPSRRLGAAALICLLQLAAGRNDILFRVPNAFGTYLSDYTASRTALYLEPATERGLAARWLTPFYRKLRFMPRDSQTLIEAPYSGFHFLPYRDFQVLHRQRILGGLLPPNCDESWRIGDGLAASTVRRFGTLVDVLDREAVASTGARWILLHREPFRHVAGGRPALEFHGYDYARCRARLERIYGVPVIEDDAGPVFSTRTGPSG